MGKIIVYIGLLLSSFLSYGQIRLDSILGESLDVDVKFGIFKVGKGNVSVDPELFYPVPERPHFQITFKIESTGIISFLYPNLQICYESYISTEEFYPYSSLLDMSYKKAEVNIDYYTYQDSIYIKSHDVTKNTIREFVFDYSEIAGRDILGTYLFAREYNLDTITRKKQFPFFLGNKFQKCTVYPYDEIRKIDDSRLKRHLIEVENIKDLPKSKKSYVWMSEENKPQLITLGTKFGTITLEIKG